MVANNNKEHLFWKVTTGTRAGTPDWIILSLKYSTLWGGEESAERGVEPEKPFFLEGSRVAGEPETTLGYPDLKPCAPAGLARFLDGYAGDRQDLAGEE